MTSANNFAAAFCISPGHLAHQKDHMNGTFNLRCEDCVADMRKTKPESFGMEQGGFWFSETGEPGMTGSVEFVRAVAIGGHVPAITGMASGPSLTVTFRDSLFVNTSNQPGPASALPNEWWPRQLGKRCYPHVPGGCAFSNSPVVLMPLWGEGVESNGTPVAHDRTKYQYGGLRFEVQSPDCQSSCPLSHRET